MLALNWKPDAKVIQGPEEKTELFTLILVKLNYLIAKTFSALPDPALAVAC